MKRSIAYSQNYMTKYKKCFSVLEKKLLPTANEKPCCAQHIYCEVSFK